MLELCFVGHTCTKSSKSLELKRILSALSYACIQQDLTARRRFLLWLPPLHYPARYRHFWLELHARLKPHYEYLLASIKPPNYKHNL